MRFSFVPLLLLLIPLAEIGTFIVVGGKIGVFWTLAMVFATAVLGTILLRVQGLGLMNKIQREMADGRVPGRELVHGVMIMIAGVLLLTPGFITDTIGFLLFVPAIRDAGWRLLKNRISQVSVNGFSKGGFAQGGFTESNFNQDNFTENGVKPKSEHVDSPTIDLDEEEFHRDPDPDSPWNKN